MFLTRDVAFLLLVSLGSAIDAVMSRRSPILQRGSSRLDFLEDIVVRLALAGYLLALCSNLAVVPWGSRETAQS